MEQYLLGRAQLCRSVPISQVEGPYQPSSNNALHERITWSKLSWVMDTCHIWLSLLPLPPSPNPPPFSNLDVDSADQCVNYSKIPSELRLSRGPHVILLDCRVTIFQQLILDIHGNWQKFYLQRFHTLAIFKLPEEDCQSVIEALQIKFLPTTVNVRDQSLKCPHVVSLSSSLAAWSSTRLISFKTRRWALVSHTQSILGSGQKQQVLSLRLVVQSCLQVLNPIYFTSV